MREGASSPEPPPPPHSEEECLFTHRQRGEGGGGLLSEAGESTQDPPRGADDVVCCCCGGAAAAPRCFLSGKVRAGHPGAFGASVASRVASYTFRTSRFHRQMCILLESGPASGRLADVSSHETGFKCLGVISGRPTKSFFLFLLKTCVLYVIGAFVF